MAYVDGFVIPVHKKKVKAYMNIARQAAKVWRDHGALEYRECVGDDLDVKGLVPFPKLAKTKPGETVFFSWILYKSKAHRDSVMKKVMKDPRMNEICGSSGLPFDFKRMAYGGFKIVVDA